MNSVNKELQILSKTFTSLNVLTVSVGTNTPWGGDAGHGGVTVFELVDRAATNWVLEVEEHSGNKTRISNIKKIQLQFYGDSEAATFYCALKFALKVLELQWIPELVVCGGNSECFKQRLQELLSGCL